MLLDQPASSSSGVSLASQSGRTRLRYAGASPAKLQAGDDMWNRGSESGKGLREGASNFLARASYTLTAEVLL
jgi:hypothetical protein